MRLIKQQKRRIFIKIYQMYVLIWFKFTFNSKSPPSPWNWLLGLSPFFSSCFFLLIFYPLYTCSRFFSICPVLTTFSVISLFYNDVVLGNQEYIVFGQRNDTFSLRPLRNISYYRLYLPLVTTHPIELVASVRLSLIHAFLLIFYCITAFSKFCFFVCWVLMLFSVIS